MKLDAREARNLLRSGDFVSLATQSLRMSGFPFLSHAPIAFDGSGQLVLLLSRLAEHSRNLGANPCVSVMSTPGAENPQAQPRVTVVGELRSARLTPAQQDRYLRYHPDAGAYLGFGDFLFYRLEPLRVRFVGGFARAGWIEAPQWKSRALDERREVELLGELAEPAERLQLTLLGLDWGGLDVRSAQGERARAIFAQTLEDEAALVHAAQTALAGAT